MISTSSNITDAVEKELRSALQGNKDIIEVIDKIFEKRFNTSYNNSSGYFMRCYSYGMVHFVNHILKQNNVFNKTSFNPDVISTAHEFYKSLIALILSPGSNNEIKLTDLVNTVFIIEQVDLSEKSIISYLKNLGENYNNNSANRFIVSSNYEPLSGWTSLQQTIYKRIQSLKYLVNKTWKTTNWQRNEEIFVSICFGIFEYIENSGHLSFPELGHQLSRLNSAQITLDRSEFIIIEKPTTLQTNIMLRLGIPLPPLVLDLRKSKPYITEKLNHHKYGSNFET